MSVTSSLKRAVDVIDSFERHGIDVKRVQSSKGERPAENNQTVQISTTHQLFDGSSLPNDVSLTVTDADLDDGVLQVTVSATFEDEAHTQRSVARTDSPPELDSSNNPQVPEPTSMHRTGESTPPPDENPDALRTVYRECNSFREMRDELSSDVTPETIRRRMIRHGIHTVPGSDAATNSQSTEPTSEASQPDEPDDAHGPDEATGTTESVLPDGGIAPDVGVDELVESVVASDTVYEAHTRLGLDLDRTQQLLRKLDLIDLVTGRLETVEARTVTREAVEKRLRTTARKRRETDELSRDVSID